MKSIFNILVLAVLTGSLISCSDNRTPNYHFMPDMYYPVGYQPYGEYDIFPGGQSAMLPVEGTIPRGWAPYDYENNIDGFNRARTELKNPLSVTRQNLAAGSQLYTFNCAVCHGDKGDGQGILAQREKFLGVPSFADPGRIITEGSIYHVQMYGLNAMGSYASQTDEKERWQITMHVQNLKAGLKGSPQLIPVEDTPAATTPPVRTLDDTVPPPDDLTTDEATPVDPNNQEEN